MNYLQKDKLRTRITYLIIITSFCISGHYSASLLFNFKTELEPAVRNEAEAAGAVDGTSGSHDN